MRASRLKDANIEVNKTSKRYFEMVAIRKKRNDMVDWIEGNSH
jgi:hypothetical protein